MIYNSPYKYWPAERGQGDQTLPVKIIGILKHLPIVATLAIILQGGQNLVSIGNFQITGKCFRIKNLPKI